MKHAMKKILCTVLVVVLCMTSVPLQGFVGVELPKWNFKASARELAATGQCGDNVYWHYKPGTITITGSGDMWNYDSSLDSPFAWVDVSNVVIENGVTSIGNHVFDWPSGNYGNDSLNNIVIADSVVTIGEYAFSSCEALTSVVIPDSVTTIKERAFYKCFNLANISLGDGLVNIEREAFSMCYGIRSIVIPDNVITIEPSVFFDCHRLRSITFGNGIAEIGACAFEWCFNIEDIYYNGTESQWNLVNIGEENEYYFANATMHYVINDHPNNPIDPDNPTDPNNPTDPDTPNDKPKEEPRDFLDYEVDSGKLEEVIYGVDSNGNECITEVIVDGKKYGINKNAEIIALSQGQPNQNVAFAVLDDEIVMIMPATFLVEDSVTSHIKDDIGLYCSYGDMYSEEDENRGFKWSEPDENNIIYPIYEEFNPNKELHLSIYLIQDDLYVAPTHGEFDYELMEYIASQIPEAQIHIDKIQLKLRNTNAISFNGKDTYTINVNADTKSNETLYKSVPIKVKSEYEIPEDKKVELVLFDIIITGKQNGEEVEFTNTDSIKIRNYDYVEPTKDKNTNKPTGKQYAKEAAEKLDAISGAITLTGLWELFSSEELEYIGNVLLAEIAMAKAPRETLENYLSTKVIEKLFNIDSPFLSLRNEEIEVTVAGNTKYGEIKLKLICKYSKVAFYGSDYCFTGQVNYEVIGGKGAKKLPGSFKKSGLAGMFSSVDMESFCNSAYKLFETHLHSGVDEVWGNDVDGAADIVFGTIVNDVLAKTKLKSVSNISFELITKPGKSVTISCPVDVFVYNENDELVAAVVGNEVILTDDKVQISVDGDVKTVKLFDESYNIIYRAIADGEMQITVDEYGTSTGLLNSSTITEIPLIAGRTYTQAIDNEYVEDSDYTVISASGNEYVPDSTYTTLDGHDYIVIYKEVNCVESGSQLLVCKKCGETKKEATKASGHVFKSGESKCSNCDFDKADDCSCNCHASGIKRFFFNFILFFQKIFRANKECKCGISHY